jgi:glutathione S-transferase
MALTLYFHPLASFCHKVLIALYENETPFTGRIVDLADKDASAALADLWALAKIPVLHDDSPGRTIPETSIIVEYLEQHYPGARPLLPREAAERLETRLWDRFFDLYVQVPMQKVVTDRLRADGEHDARGVADARSTLGTAYDMIERRMSDRTWGGRELHARGLRRCASAVLRGDRSAVPGNSRIPRRLCRATGGSPVGQACHRRSPTVLPPVPVQGRYASALPSGRGAGGLR